MKSVSVRFVLFCCCVTVFMAGCASAPHPIGVDTHMKTTVAVWDIDEVGIEQDLFGNVGEILTSVVMETFTSKDTFRLVEREKLLLALEELNIGSSDLASEDTRLEIGKMVGARLMVFGGYQVVAGTMRLDLRLVDVETGKILRTASKIVNSHDMDEWLDAAREAAKELAR